eukprot:TRINITY_DN81245_c0_g1_i1.p1 TRINITY_DN81245_c0_g1~~TRINITY_DN81245_c0_g1_i1.p1  ORF type:complete len:515 (+),score=90.71 TRINITY_DN81245_c0_g1_i1:113-1657(+)
MEGRAGNFHEVLSDFEARLPNAEFVALRTNFTGLDGKVDPHAMPESASERFEKVCWITESHLPIQVGITLVSSAKDLVDERVLDCATYNLWAFPYVGCCDEDLGHEAHYFQLPALRLVASQGLNFNTWIREGIPYMSRQDETNYLAAARAAQAEEGKAPSEESVKSGLLRLWELLCQAKLPFVVHAPLDLFLVLAAFEGRESFKSHDVKEVSRLVNACCAKVYDTSHLCSLAGTRRSVERANEALEDLRAQYAVAKETAGSSLPTLSFPSDDQKGKYGRPASESAGFASKMVAKLFVHLAALHPRQVSQGAGRLYLNAGSRLNVEEGVLEGLDWRSSLDLSKVTLLVADLEMGEELKTARQIAAAKYSYKWLSASHLLIVLPGVDSAAVEEATALARHVQGVSSWMSVEEWQAKMKPKRTESRAGPAPIFVNSVGSDTPTQPGESCSEGSSADCDTFVSPTPPMVDAACDVDPAATDGAHKRRTFPGVSSTLLALGGAGALLLLAFGRKPRLQV